MTERPLLHDTTAHHLDLLLAKRAGSYAFVGPKGVGKFMAARWLADQIALAADIVILSPTDKSSLGIAAARELRQTLSQGRASERERVVIIDDADMLTADAQNALLKTLEEPPSHTTIILITTNYHQLLTTIRSRLVPIRFGPVATPAIKSLITAQTNDVPSNLDDIIAMNPGAPGRILGIIQEADQGASWSKAHDLTEELLKAQPFRGLTLAAGLADDKALQADFLAIMAYKLRQGLRTDIATSQRCMQLLEALECLSARLATHVPARAAFEAFALEVTC